MRQELKTSLSQPKSKFHTERGRTHTNTINNRKKTQTNKNPQMNNSTTTTKSITTTSGRGPVSSSLLPRPPRAPLDPRPGRGRLPKLISSWEVILFTGFRKTWELSSKSSFCNWKEDLVKAYSYSCMSFSPPRYTFTLYIID